MKKSQLMRWVATTSYCRECEALADTETVKSKLSSSTATERTVLSILMKKSNSEDEPTKAIRKEKKRDQHEVLAAKANQMWKRMQFFLQSTGALLAADSSSLDRIKKY